MPGNAPMLSATLLTIADLDRVPGPELPHELWRGVLCQATAAGSRHGATCGRTSVTLGRFIQDRDLGELFVDSGFVLDRDPDTLLCPDVAFVAKHRLPPGGIPATFLELAPDLAVEVLSPSNRAGQIRTKIRMYLDFGTRVVWVLDPIERRLQAHTRECDGKAASVTLRGEDTIAAAGEILPGFRCRLADFFPSRF